MQASLSIIHDLIEESWFRNQISQNNANPLPMAPTLIEMTDLMISAFGGFTAE